KVPAPCRLPRDGGERKEACISRLDLLGQARAGIRRSARRSSHFGTCARGAWRKSDGARFHGGSLGGFSVCGSLQSGLRKSAYVCAARRWPASEECVYRGNDSLRASREQTSSVRNHKLPKLFGARAGNFAAPCRVGAGKNRVGSVPGGSQTTWADRVESGFSLCAWSGSRTARRLPAALWCLSPEPAEHADGPCDARHVR